MDTVTVTGAEVVLLPALSRATAVRVCEPLLAVVVSHGTEYGAVVSSALKVPSKKNCTSATPLLSDALAVTLIVPETVAPEAGEVMLTVGGVLSGLGHVKPGMHGNICAKASDGIHARPQIANKAAARARFTIFSMDSPLRR